MFDVLLLTFLAGLAAFTGAVLGWFDKIKSDWLECPSRHAIMAFGGGALLSAVALVLVPHGMKDVPLHFAAASFLGGAIFFMLVSACFTLRQNPLSQFMTMMLDFVPEAIVIGAVISTDYRQAVFLAVLIAAQNMPEGFNAFREITTGERGLNRRNTLILLGLASASGMVWGMVGYSLFEPEDLLLKLMMMFCAGGIFYLVFRDVAPESRVKGQWSPSLGAVSGFLLGIIGHGLI